MNKVYKTSDVNDEFAAARQQLEFIVERLQSEGLRHAEHGEIEQVLHSDGMELLRRLMQGHLDLRCRDEIKLDGVVGTNGSKRTHVRSNCRRQLMTLFGEVVLYRHGYCASGERRLYPLDGELNLPADRYSDGLRRRASESASKNSFDECVEEVEKASGGKVPKRQAQALVKDVSQDFELFYQTREAQKSEETDGAPDNIPLVLSVDGKGIVMLPSGLREGTRRAAERENKTKNRKTRLSPGEKRNRKRMATVATVYSVEKHHRTAEQIMGKEDRAQPAPRARDKRVWASLEREMSEVIEEQFREALVRDPEKLRPWVVLLDGNLSQLEIVKSMAKKHQLDLTVTVDFIHVLEYLWKAAHCLKTVGSKDAEDWVAKRALRILQGKASGVAAGIRRSATLNGLAKDARKGIDDCANYLLKFRDYLRYDENLERGLPIATGVIEGACRHLIKDRMDITGARWGLPGAEAVLKLRSLRSSGDFDEYWVDHKRRSLERNHLSNYAENRLPMAA